MGVGLRHEAAPRSVELFRADQGSSHHFICVRANGLTIPPPDVKKYANLELAECRRGEQQTTSSASSSASSFSSASGSSKSRTKRRPPQGIVEAIMSSQALSRIRITVNALTEGLDILKINLKFQGDSLRLSDWVASAELAPLVEFVQDQCLSKEYGNAPIDEKPERIRLCLPNATVPFLEAKIINTVVAEVAGCCGDGVEAVAGADPSGTGAHGDTRAISDATDSEARLQTGMPVTLELGSVRLRRGAFSARCRRSGSTHVSLSLPSINEA